jgi:peptide/nickel transport system permease protein
MRLGEKKLGLDVIVSGVILLIAAFLFAMSFFYQEQGLRQNILEGGLGPWTDGHIFGTDSFGRDVLRITIAGTKSALTGPLLIALGSIAIGFVLGSIAGYFGGVADWIISRYADLTLSMPSLLLAIVAAGLIGGGYYVSVLVLIILYSPFDIRIVRSAVLAEKSKPYIEAIRISKFSAARILFVHVFPNIALLVLVNFFLNIGYAIVSMSSLSYLGLGVGAGSADWGRQLSDGRELMFDNPAAILVPAIAIILVSVAVNIVGNYLAEKND